MAFIQCIIETNAERAELLSEVLMEAGCEAVTFEDAKQNPIFEPPPNTEILWNNTRVIGLFLIETFNLSEIQHSLKESLDEFEMQNIRFEPLEDQDWVSLTQVTKPLSISDKLYIGPQNLEEARNTNIPYLILDPGLAFGTGTHPTTQLCLKCLVETSPKNQIVLDYGCGSGILGLSALKLGAKMVYAVDHDPQALYSTRNNALKNDFNENQIKPYLPNELPKNLKVDLILANILANPLIELAPIFAEHLKPKGTLILSGILTHQTDSIIQHYAKWFSNFNVETQDEWALISAFKF